MKKYLSHFGLKARNNAWPYRTSPYAEREFEPFTQLVQMEEPRLYYTNPRKVVRFRVETSSVPVDPVKNGKGAA
jgi:hypothetical protein